MPQDWLTQWTRDIELWEKAQAIAEEYGMDAFDILPEAQKVLDFMDEHGGRLPTPEEEI